MGTADGPLRSPFIDPGFTDVEVLAVDGDHVAVMTAEGRRSFAFGHLPDHVRAMIVPGLSAGVLTATADARTLLGLHDDQAISDLRDPRPTACPVTMALIREHAQCPADVLAGYRRAVAILGGVTGYGRSRVNDEGMAYKMHDGMLGVALTCGRTAFTGDGAVLIDVRTPETVLRAAVGMRARDVFDHPALRPKGVVITSATLAPDGRTRLEWRADPVPVT